MDVTYSSNAATLTYTIAPRPFSYHTIFAMLINSSAANKGKTGVSKGWINAILGTIEDRRIKSTIKAFTNCFSRQLEVLNTQLVVSVNCALLSYGQPKWGVLWATSHGLYFRSSAAKNNNINNKISTLITSPTSSNVSPTTSKVSNNNNNNREEEEIIIWGDESSAIREALPFKDIISLLPSISLPTSNESTPYVSGVPNPIVTPNALQVFTISPKQIYQFVYIHNIIVIPPSLVLNSKGEMKEIILQHEYDAIKNFPNNLDALIFCALTERLWEARLLELRLPLLREDVEYADAH